MTCMTKITEKKKKLQLLAIKVKDGDVSAFPILETCLELGSSVISLQDTIAQHLLSMADQFTEYFLVEARPKWIRDPFSVEMTEMPDDLTGAEQEKLLELSLDSTLVLSEKKGHILTLGSNESMSTQCSH